MSAKMEHWPADVGIKAIDFVFPKMYVDQAELERFDGVSAGKYTEGLGQKQMGFSSELEDINSLCLTAFSQLVERNGLRYEEIGRVDVGTETIVDKSKSVKTVLMELFAECGNHDVEGLDTTNACYGGTAALFNAVAWVESSAWDGRAAVVVAGDIAVYAKGNARPTGGCGAVAMLVGPGAPLVLERGLRATYMANVYDFYKPDLTSEYPVVDGPLSIKCYLKALDNCYEGYARRAGRPHFDLEQADAVVFHSPFCKLVQKSLARLALNDLVRARSAPSASAAPPDAHLPEALRNATLEGSYGDRQVEKELMALSRDAFERKTARSLLLASRVGNMYTASVYSCLLSHLLETPLAQLAGQRIVVFSYGSGLASSMYSLRVKGGAELETLVERCAHVRQNLDSRVAVSPQQFSDILEQRQKSLHAAPYASQRSTDELFAGTWYLAAIDEKHRRTYARKSS